MFISTDNIFNLKGKENLSGRLKEVKPRSPKQSVIKLGFQPGVSSIIWAVRAHWSQARRKNLETQREVFPLFRAQAPGYHKSLQATIELM